MNSAVIAIRSLLAATFMLMAGSGFLQTLISLRLERANVDTLSIGMVATAYFAGLIVGSLRAAPMVYRVGHIRAFAAFVSLFSASSLAYMLYQSAPFWGVLRFVDGLCIAGIFICLESWLNERASQQFRAGILASYMISLYLGQAAGQFLLHVSDARPSLPFLAASILISLALIPVVLTRIAAPTPGNDKPLTMGDLYTVSPLGAVGTVATGLMLGAFYGLGAVHVRRIGLDLSQTAFFMSVVIAGGVTLQWPLGRLSDRFDRRRVIVCVFAGAAIFSAGLAVVQQESALLLLGLLYGGFSFALYPLCVAHTNDHLEPERRVAASGGLVLLYSLGAVIGPIAGAQAMTMLGDVGLFAYIGCCAAAMFVFGLWRQFKSAPVPAIAQGQYRILPRTTPVAATLVPHGADHKGM